MPSPKLKRRPRIRETFEMQDGEKVLVIEILDSEPENEVVQAPPLRKPTTDPGLSEYVTKTEESSQQQGITSAVEESSTSAGNSKETEEDPTEDDSEESPSLASRTPPSLPRVVVFPNEEREKSVDDQDQSDGELYLKEYDTEKYHRFLDVAFGGCSRVYSAIDRTTGEEVIVKRPVVKNGYEFMFNDEIELLQAVQGPGVVEYKDRFRCKNLDFLVMEKMETDLYSILSEFGKFTEANRKQFIKMALTGLKTVHDQGYIHQDVKPDNFLFSRTKGLKLSDFGRATKDDGQPKFTNSYYRNYRPLELLEGGSKIDRKADLWALGCIHQDLIMGKGLWTNSQTDEQQAVKVKTVVNSDCLRETKQFNELGDLEFSFLSRLMQLDPKKRPSVDEAFADEWFITEPLPTPVDRLPVMYCSRNRGRPSKKTKPEKRSREEDPDVASSKPSGSSKRPHKEEPEHITGIFSAWVRDSNKRKRTQPRSGSNHPSEDEEDKSGQTKRPALIPSSTEYWKDYFRDEDDNQKCRTDF